MASPYSRVIPFQTPSLGKVGYEMQEKKKAEIEGRRKETKKSASELYEGFNKIPANAQIRKELNVEMQEYLDLSTKYEMGDKSLETELESRKQSMMGAINKAVAYTNFIDKNYANFYMSQDEYDDDVETATGKRNAAYENLTMSNLNDPDWLTRSAVEFSPMKKVTAPKFLTVDTKTLPYLPTAAIEKGVVWDRNTGVESFSDEGKILEDLSVDIYEAAKGDPELDLAIKIRAMRKRDPNFEYNASTVNELKKFNVEEEYKAAVREYAQDMIDAYRVKLDNTGYKPTAVKQSDDKEIKLDDKGKRFAPYANKISVDNKGRYIAPENMIFYEGTGDYKVERTVDKIYFGTEDDVDAFRVEFGGGVPPITGYKAFKWFTDNFGFKIFEYYDFGGTSNKTQTNTQQQAKSGGTKLTFPQWKKANPNGSAADYKQYLK
jgi:hypothetical protein